MNPWYVTAAILVAWAVTYALRAAPFIASRWLRNNPVVDDLALVLPVGVMATLVVGMLQDTPVTDWAWLPTAIATAATVGVHLWRSNTLLSIATGVVVYGILTAIL